MANLQETESWEAGIYQLEMTDPVVAGPPDLAQSEGFANVQALQLANRTAWLKAQLAAVQNALGNLDFTPQIQAKIDELVDSAPGALNTLNELAVALQSNDSEIAALVSQIAAMQNSVNNIDVTAQINAAINNLVNGAPAALNTLRELALALQSNDSEIATLVSQVSGVQTTYNNLVAGAPAALNTLKELADAVQSNDGDIASLSSQMSQVSGKVLGVGQSWQAPARNLGTTYQNTTGRPIMVSVGFRWNGGYAQVSANGSSWITIGRGSEHTGDTNNADFIVPHGHFYKVTGGTKHYWSELR